MRGNPGRGKYRRHRNVPLSPDNGLQTVVTLEVFSQANQSSYSTLKVFKAYFLE